MSVRGLDVLMTHESPGGQEVLVELECAPEVGHLCRWEGTGAAEG